MPALNLPNTGKAVAKAHFIGLNLTLPTVVPRPKPGERPAARPQGAPLASPPMLFRSASNDLADIANQKDQHAAFDKLFDQMLDAIEFAFNLYRLQAGLINVIINGPVAIGGFLSGPPLDNLIRTAPGVAGFTGPQAAIRDAVAAGLSQQWLVLSGSVRVPGLPWYPAFAAFPGPTAPPMPNTPTPFIALLHDINSTSPENLKLAMRSALKTKVDFSGAFFESIGAGFQTALTLWKAVQQVSLVMGTGQVPSFAPPFVPVGPVINGVTLPGRHLIA